MKKSNFTFYLLIAIGLLAWPLAYGPGLFQRHQTFEALESSSSRTACLLSSDVVGYYYDGITTRPYILLDGKRYYNEDFRKWNTVAGRILLVTDASGRQHWTKLNRAEATDVARRYQVALQGCRQLRPETMEARYRPRQEETPLLAAVPAYQLEYDQNQMLQPKANFSWEKAVGRAAQPAATRKHLP